MFLVNQDKIDLKVTEGLLFSLVAIMIVFVILITLV